ncbi:MAG: alpha/beta hydrolase [Acetobacteraceae bacterium]|nr:alpha/beta hydrolase [Acetobacteraceae bacterium]
MTPQYPEPQRQEMILPEGRVETAWWGPGPDEAPSLVLLHEGLGSVTIWRDFPARLAAATGCGVFAYSRFGYGHSDTVQLPRPLTYLHDDARLVPRVLDGIGIARCVLIGHSDGGSIAAIAGAENDPRVRGLVLIAAHFFVEEEQVEGVAAVRRRWFESDLRDRLARHHADPDTAFFGWNDTWLNPQFHSFDISRELSQIRAPMLVMQGQYDEHATEEQVRFAARKAGGPTQTIILPGAHHSPHLEMPEQTLAPIVGFVHRVLHWPKPLAA